MNTIEKLRATVENLAALAEEKRGLEQRMTKASAEIAAAAEEKMTDKTEAKISRASAVLTVCRARIARMEDGSKPEAETIKELYLAARNAWNRACEVRREMARADFITSNMRFFDNDEKITGYRLQGILPLPLARVARAGWNGIFRHGDSPFDILQDVEQFISHVERHGEENGIPLDF